MVLVEEALRAKVPVLVLDVKGDLPNLLLAFPTFAAAELLPWTEGAASATDERAPELIAEDLADERRRGLTAWSITESELTAFAALTDIRVITPGRRLANCYRFSRCFLAETRTSRSIGGAEYAARVP
jgi:hypothetical protein